MDKLLSICIPTYNRMEQLKRQIEFLKNERVFTLENVEVIISDNASPDGTYEKYLVNIQEPNIRIFKQKKNIGGINNIHAVLREIRGCYSWIIGDDDILQVGIFKKVIDILNKYPNIDYLFVNHKAVFGNVIVKESFFSSKGGYYENGYVPFEKLVCESGFGPAMFITANIFRSSKILEVNMLLDKNNELENMAPALAYSICASNGPAYFISEPMIQDQCEGITWADKIWLVHCRDMIAVVDLVGTYIGKGDQIRNLLLKNLPASYPELKYIFVKRKFKKNNYALEMYCKYFPMRLLYDIFVAVPFIVIPKKMYNKGIGGMKKIYNWFRKCNVSKEH